MRRVGQLLVRKFPEGIAEYASDGMDGVALFRIVPEVISVLDYRKSFSHTDLVRDPGALGVAPDTGEDADEETLRARDPSTR
jgi:hypothetical protein